jgi:hypothetical protein
MAKQKEADAPLPAGWIRTESKSRPGEIVYENTSSGERQAWFPDEPALSKEEIKKQDLMKKNKEALAARKKAIKEVKKDSKDADAKRKLPSGWKRVESRSRPGEYVYENTLTDERQAWFPEEAAAKPLPEVGSGHVLGLRISQPPDFSCPALFFCLSRLFFSSVSLGPGGVDTC